MNLRFLLGGITQVRVPEAKGLSGSFQINEKNERPIKIISIGESTIAVLLIL